jgi:F-box/leucine-rich repeat protein 2/20
MNPSATIVGQAPIAPWCVCDVVELILEFLRPFTTITSLRAVNRTFRQAVGNTREVWPSMFGFGWRCNGTHVASILQLCPRVTSLDVSNAADDFDDAAVASVAANVGSRLTHLNVSRTSVTDEGLIALAEHCAHIKHLNVSFCKPIGDRGISAIATACNANLLELHADSTYLTDEGLRAVSLSCPRLQRLNVALGNVSPVGFAAIAGRCSELRHLDASSTIKKDAHDEVTRVIAAGCPQLVHLNVTNTSFSDVGATAIAGSCPKLEVLNIAKTKVTDAGILAVSRMCSQLRHLNVRDTSGAIGDSSIIAIAQSCSQLRHLNVNATTRITDSAIEHVARHCPLLEHLDISYTQIGDSGVIAIARGCPRLRVLDVSLTDGNVSDESLVEVARGCPRLQHLDVRYTNCKITDTGVLAIVQSCSELRFLDVRYAGGVTDVSMRAVARYCPRLRQLCAKGKNGVTNEGLDAVQQAHPECKVG